MITTLISFVFATVTLAFSPGPDNIFVLTQGVVNGKKYGFATVAGLMLGCLVHTSFVAFGVSEVIKRNSSIFLVIKLIGVFYMLYLAYDIYKSDASITFSTENIDKKNTIELFKIGFWMNVLNPKITIFFLAFLPQFLFSDKIPSLIQFYVLGGIFILTSFIVFSSIVLLADSLSGLVKKNKKIGEYFKWAQIIVFVTIAILILF